MDCIWSFLSHNPMQKAAYTNEAIVQELMKKHPGLHSNHFKREIYDSFYPMKKRKKQTGFETYAELDFEVREELLTIIDQANYPQKFDKLREVKNYHSEHGSYIEECIKEALNDEQIAISYNKELILCLSGGIDSELMVRIFHQAGVKFKVFVMNFGTDNLYDLQHAFSLIEELNLDAIIYDFDVETFFNSSEIREMSAKYQESSPQILTYRKMVELIRDEYNGFSVLAGEYRLVFEEEKLMAVANAKVDGFLIYGSTGVDFNTFSAACVLGPNGEATGGQTITSWYLPETVGIGNSYWVRATNNGGDTMGPGSEPLNTWLSLSVSRGFNTTQVGPFPNTRLCKLFFEFAAFPGGPVLTTGDCDVFIERLDDV